LSIARYGSVRPVCPPLLLSRGSLLGLGPLLRSILWLLIARNRVDRLVPSGRVALRQCYTSFIGPREALPQPNNDLPHPVSPSTTTQDPQAIVVPLHITAEQPKHECHLTGHEEESHHVVHIESQAELQPSDRTSWRLSLRPRTRSCRCREGRLHQSPSIGEGLCHGGSLR
jgi:hypothetical protein